MDDKDRKCLRSNASFIGDHMYVDDGFLNKLFQEEILSQSMKEKIQVNKFCVVSSIYFTYIYNYIYII